MTFKLTHYQLADTLDRGGGDVLAKTTGGVESRPVSGLFDRGGAGP